MKTVVIVDCVRTAMGRSKGGVFRHTRSEDLSAAVMKSLLCRNPQIAPNTLNDIIWGCVMQTREQGFNVARNAALIAGIPQSVPAVTVNCLCGSSMQALHDAAMRIMAGYGDTYLVGGVEHMGHIPMTDGVDFHPLIARNVAKGAGSMGLTAEMLAVQYNISREEQDVFAMASHQKAHSAATSGHFGNEIIAVEGHTSTGEFVQVTQDEVIRPDTNLDSLSKLSPVFNPASGTVTAGTSSALSDGASGLLVMSEQKATELGLTPLVKVKAMAVAGCSPSIMGIGPVPATQHALKIANLSLQQIDVIELNEAFAAQSLAVMKAIGITNTGIVNQHGGAIALGHPLGCSGARISTTLINIMQKNNSRYGLATMCIGLGQGIATIFERV